MNRRVIHKYCIWGSAALKDQHDYAQIPLGAEPITLRATDDAVYLYAIVDPDETIRAPRPIVVQETGSIFEVDSPIEAFSAYFGTVECFGLVLHFFINDIDRAAIQRQRLGRT